MLSDTILSMEYPSCQAMAACLRFATSSGWEIFSSTRVEKCRCKGDRDLRHTRESGYLDGLSQLNRFSRFVWRPTHLSLREKCGNVYRSRLAAPGDMNELGCVLTRYEIFLASTLHGRGAELRYVVLAGILSR